MRLKVSEFKVAALDPPMTVHLPNRADWRVVAVSTRDSPCLSARRAAQAEAQGCEVHRFGHWACGWFEVIIEPPGGDV